MSKKTIGIDVEAPKTVCTDKNCPFHSNISLRGKIFKGEIVSNIFHRTATIQWQRRKFIPKYERYEKRRTKIKAHTTPCMDVKKGDIVKIMETRPISKTKSFIVIEKITKQEK